MSNIKNSRGASQPEVSEQFVPDVYYFPTQVEWELTNIQNNLLGKILTLIETLNLTPKQEKATKDLIRTTIKEQMISTRSMLDKRKEIKEIDKTIEKIGKVRKMILDKHKKDIDEHKDVVGELKCPYCGGKIRYGMANSINGHVHAFCENECVGWEE